MNNPRTGRDNSSERHHVDDSLDVPGDPGVGGLLVDPEEPVLPKRRRKPVGTPSPDPEPPEAHGDWLPTHASKNRSGR